MELLPDTPAELCCRASSPEETKVVARGPLMIMVHGLMAIAPKQRESCWIRTSRRDLTTEEAADALGRWLGARIDPD